MESRRHEEQTCNVVTTVTEHLNYIVLKLF